eukprot:GILI01008740.1.p1 GENE.GILI01008740.1~~GILI01008740.1.p1  ORF type:complete len:150 (+),score=65.13 GILI01008740.1:59-451(+)
MADTQQTQKNGNIINISSSKRPFYYSSLGKRFLTNNETIELHGLGNAIGVAVGTSEILTRQEFVVLKSVQTTTVDVAKRNGDNIRKPKIVIVLAKSAKFNDLWAAEQAQLAQKQQTAAASAPAAAAAPAQ